MSKRVPLFIGVLGLALIALSLSGCGSAESAATATSEDPCFGLGGDWHTGATRLNLTAHCDAGLCIKYCMGHIYPVIGETFELRQHLPDGSFEIGFLMTSDGERSVTPGFFSGTGPRGNCRFDVSGDQLVMDCGLGSPVTYTRGGL